MRRKKRGDEDGYSYICAICEDFGELLCCERCRQGFHLTCVGLESCPDDDSWLCGDCSQNKVRCFDCKDYGSFKEDTYRCGIALCGKIYHLHCIKRWDRPQPRGRTGVICPHHYCDVCWNTQARQSAKGSLYRCLKCPTACHESCMPDGAGLLEDIPGFMLCAKHNEAWKRRNDGNALTEDVTVGFNRLPLPSVPQDFKLPVSLKAAVKRSLNRPAPYVHIRRNIYLVKKPRKKTLEENTQCPCSSSDSSGGGCDKDCECGILFTSCSEICKCGGACSNVSFQKRPGRKMKAVKTERCGWGLKADEDIKAGDFLVEYVGEVIDDQRCEERLWAMKEKGESNFYMCEISREMVIDATFKGNLSRFINHSCSPNCELQKWDIEGEVRIGVFATQDIKKGQFVSYDYQFIQFGSDQHCHCGAPGCSGQLGKPHQKHKISEPTALKSIAEPVLARSSKRSKLYESFSIEQGCGPMNGGFRPQKNSFGAALKVVQADVHYGRRREDGFEGVGLRVRVWWPLDQKYYEGKIVRYDPAIGTHQIMYDDGQEEDLLMTKEQWDFIESLPSRTQNPSLLLPSEKNEKSSILEPNGPQSPVLEGRRFRSRVLSWRREESAIVEIQKRSQSPVLELRRDQTRKIEKRDQAPTLEWKSSRIRSFVSRRTKRQSPLMIHQGSQSSASQVTKETSVSVTHHYTRLCQGCNCWKARSAYLERLEVRWMVETDPLSTSVGLDLRRLLFCSSFKFTCRQTLWNIGSFIIPKRRLGSSLEKWIETVITKYISEEALLNVEERKRPHIWNDERDSKVLLTRMSRT